MSRLIETIRIADGKIENIEYHFKRMRLSKPSFDWDLNEILTISLPSQGIHKLRVVYDSKIKTLSISPYKIRPVRSLKLVFDDNIVYDHKFEDRTYLDRLSAMKDDCDDVLIVKNGLVTDVSYANIIFRRDNRWYTPDSFLLNGTMRQRLLDMGRITEQQISVDDLRQYSHFKLINAMLRDDALESQVLNIR